MFQKLLTLIRQVISKMFPKANMSEALQIDIPVSDEMSTAIDLWHQIYINKSPWVDGEKIKSLNLGASIASELARLTTIEMSSEITSAGKKDSKDPTATPAASEFEDINEDYQKQVIDKLRVQVTYAAAKGGMMFKPYLDGDRVVVDFAQADQFFPIAFSSTGDITGCIFTERKYIGDKVFTRLELHNLNDTLYTITNRAYVAKKEEEKLGAEIALTAIDEWKDLAEEATIRFKDKAYPLFAYFKMPLANTVDTASPLGVSVFNDAIELMKDADKQYSRTMWEYEGGEMAIEAGLDMFKSGETSLPETRDRLFRKFDTDISDGKPFYEVFNPTLRDNSFWIGLNKILQRIEFQCGLAYGTLSDVQMVDKTAEEIRSSKQRSYSTVADIQKSLQVALEQLVFAMMAWKTIGQANGNKGIKEITVPENYDMSFSWDDSLVVDEKTRRAMMMTEVSAGLISGDYYLKVNYGATDEQIKEMKAVIAIDEPNPEDKNLE